MVNAEELVAEINGEELRMRRIKNVTYYNMIDVANILKIKSPNSTRARYVDPGCRVKIPSVDSRGISQSMNYINHHGLVAIMFCGADNIINNDERLTIMLNFSARLVEDLTLYKIGIGEVTNIRPVISYQLQGERFTPGPVTCSTASQPVGGIQSAHYERLPIPGVEVVANNVEVPPSLETMNMKELNQLEYYNIYQLFEMEHLPTNAIGRQGQQNYKELHSSLERASIALGKEVIKRNNGGYYYHRSVVKPAVREWNNEWETLPT